MKRPRAYVLINATPPSYCPTHPHHRVDLLTSVPHRAPFFYICWICQRVFQGGVGECIRPDARHTVG